MKIAKVPEFNLNLKPFKRGNVQKSVLSGQPQLQVPSSIDPNLEEFFGGTSLCDANIRDYMAIDSDDEY